MKTTKVYKVVSVDRKGTLRSAYVEGSLERKYGTEKFTFPAKGTKLFAFKDKRQAKHYSGYSPAYQVWEAEATGVHYNGWFCSQFQLAVAIRAFADGNMPKPTEDFSSSVVCDSIRLLKRVC